MKPPATLLFTLLFTQQLYAVGSGEFTNKPNIIFILADDLGWNSMSQGATNFNQTSDFFETPNLERMVREGVSFNNAYVNGPTCAPSRAAFLTGKYGARAENNVMAVGSLQRGDSPPSDPLLLRGPSQGIPGGAHEFPPETITLAEALTEHYVTAHIGKYQVGGSRNETKPENQGFDYNFGGSTTGNNDFFAQRNSRGQWEFDDTVTETLDLYAAPYTLEQSLELTGDNSLTGTKKHISDGLAECALDFMEQNKHEPFFINFCQYAVHAPFDRSNQRPDLSTKYITKRTSSPSSMGHSRRIGLPVLAENLDQTVGRILDYLENTDDPRNPGEKLAANTLVVFMSDNGGVFPNYNGALRGVKGQLTEGGIRVPMIIWSKGLLANNLVNTIHNSPVSAIDLYPTFLDMAGISNPEGNILDGYNLAPFIRGVVTGIDRQGGLFWHYPGNLVRPELDLNERPTTAYRNGDYKLFYFYETASYKLFNVVTDLTESSELLAQDDVPEDIQAIAHSMSQDMRQWLVSVNAPLPTTVADGRTVPLPEVYPYQSDATTALTTMDFYQTTTFQADESATTEPDGFFDEMSGEMSGEMFDEGTGVMSPGDCSEFCVSF